MLWTSEDSIHLRSVCSMDFLPTSLVKCFGCTEGRKICRCGLIQLRAHAVFVSEILQKMPERDARLSKRLAYLLRYGAEKEGVTVRDGGDQELRFGFDEARSIF